mmetsp:Transcript_34568/g.91223  ORF Transcript_34568/g.91223 Transcript_34568/m.91223 type:complete len:222 (-) Transcript_34568:334-999(-)
MREKAEFADLLHRVHARHPCHALHSRHPRHALHPRHPLEALLRHALAAEALRHAPVVHVGPSRRRLLSRPDEAHDAVRLVVLPQAVHLHTEEARGPVLADAVLREGRVRELPGQEARHRLERVLHVLRCGKGEKCAADELVPLVVGVPKHGSEGRVNFQDGSINAGIGDAHRRHHEAASVRHIDVQTAIFAKVLVRPAVSSTGRQEIDCALQNSVHGEICR